MPGIVGIITKAPRAVAEPQVCKMLETQRHEAFYSSGTWSDESLGVYVGWTAIKNSFADGMPLASERGDVHLIFSGEEYPAESAGDPSYLVHQYENDPNFLAGWNGMCLKMVRFSRTQLKETNSPRP